MSSLSAVANASSASASSSSRLLEEEEAATHFARTTAKTFSTMIYDAFGERGHTPWMLVPSATLFLIAFTGALMNSFTVYVTIKSRNLRGTCHFLLALICLGEVLHQLTHFIFFAVTVTRHFIPFMQCLHLQMPCVIGFYAVFVTSACTALDRFIAVYAPLFYKKMNERPSTKRCYLALHFALIASSVGYCATQSFLLGRHYAHEMVACDLSNIVCMPKINVVFSRIAYGSIVFAMLLYLCVWLAIRKNVKGGDVQDQLLRSLVAVVGVNIGGYLVNLGLMRLYRVILRNNFLMMWILYELSACFLNIFAAMNAPILYWMSSDYRAAFYRFTLGRFERFKKLSFFQEQTVVQFSRISDGCPPSTQWRRQTAMTTTSSDFPISFSAVNQLVLYAPHSYYRQLHHSM